ncbi:putative PAN domain protein [Trichinella spiralis]|uniref:putative PAN domain protein n=1 Tax=Trichinella spiralis TaxID=6334 RepID=UPI0001EFE74C|nr:putative PAN domain protein [Trichinella spiralis]
MSCPFSKLVSCSWMSLYIPKLDATCVLTAKAIRHEVVLHIKQAYCSMESCVAACYQLSPSCNLIKYSPFAKVCNLYYENATDHILLPIDQIGQSMHLLLHSCHEAKAGIRIGLWETVNETYCLMICLDEIWADYCDGYYFSYDGMLINIVKDLRMLPLKHSNHFTTEKKHKEICTVQHTISNVIPWINLVQLYENISFFNDCISICRFIRIFGLCLGIAYSKESKACLIAVLGNNDDEVYLNEGFHFSTLSNCSKDRENERADNDPPELHLLPILDEVCQLEFYKPLILTGWSVIAEIRNIATLQECLTNCAAVTHAIKCAAIYFIHESCFLLERMTHLQNHFIRDSDSVFAELLFCEPNIG